MDYIKMNLLDFDDNLLANAHLVSLSKEKIVAEIVLEHDEKETVTEHDLVSLTKGIQLRAIIFHNTRGVIIYTGELTYRLSQLIHIENITLQSNVQRRNDVKLLLKYDAPIVPVLVKKIGISPTVSKQIYDIQTVSFKDISAGGLCFAFDKPLNKDLLYHTVFDRGLRPVDLWFEILRISVAENGRYLHGCKFVQLPHSDESIVREYIFRTLTLAAKRKRRGSEGKKMFR